MNQKNNIVDNKRIAKNTLLLYLRMLFTMGVSLYTSRVVLNTLGVEDYGIYNVVGGVIAMFGFINGAMSSATQRFITFSLGKGDSEELSRVFSTAIQIHAMISLLIIILGETVGLWFLSNKLVIPESRMTAAMWVYQCSILVTVVNIMSVPYNADIVAHEKMSAFAYISVLETVLKLAIVFLLLAILLDKLIVYAILLLFVQIFIRMIYSLYCRRHFEESHYNHIVDKRLLKEMSGFAGWSFFGNFAAVLFGQGLNMMLNIFFGPVVNAARGIAVQVQSTVQQFVTNFQMALNPQITKTYANGDIENMHLLMFRSARFSFFVLFFLALPIILETDWILQIWLKTVPDNTVVFVRIMLCISLLLTVSNPCVIANQATGNIKKYQIVVGSLLLSILPISYVVLKLGAPAYSVFIVHFCIEIIAQFVRMIMLRNMIELPLMAYLKNIYIPIILVIATSVILPIFIHFNMATGLARFLFVGFASVISISSMVFFLGLTNMEKEFFSNKIRQFIRKNHDRYNR